VTLDRSLDDRQYLMKPDSRLVSLERLADGGYFKNSRKMKVNWYLPSVPFLFRVIRPMNNLETLSILEWELTLTDDLPQLFRSCPKLTELRLKLFESKKLEMNEELENELRSGFQRLQIFELRWDIDSGPVSREVLT